MIKDRLQFSKEDVKLIKNIFIVVIVVFILFLLFKRFTSVFLSLILIVVGSLSTIYKRFVRVSTGFELITFSTIALCFLNGPVFGIVAAVIMVVVSAFLTNRVCIPMFVQIGAYVVICLLSKIVIGESLLTGAMILVFIYNIIIHSAYVFLFRFNPANSAISFPVNIVINYLLFKNLSIFFQGLV
jgi:hypothetical protein